MEQMKETLTLPLTTTTKKFLNEDEFSKMKMETLSNTASSKTNLCFFPDKFSQHHTLGLS